LKKSLFSAEFKIALLLFHDRTLYDVGKKIFTYPSFFGIFT